MRLFFRFCSISAMRLCLSLLAWCPYAANALDIHWNGSGGLFGNPESWQNVDNWDPVGSPFQVRRVPTDLDTATLSTPANDITKLFANTAPINGLTISNGIDLHTNGHQLLVDDEASGTALVSLEGTNTRLIVDPRPGGVAVQTNQIRANDGTQLILNGGDLSSDTFISAFGGTITNAGISSSIQFGQSFGATNEGEVRLSGLAASDFSGATGSFVGASVRSLLAMEFLETFDITNEQQWDFNSGAIFEPASPRFSVGETGIGSLIISGSNTRVDTKPWGADMQPTRLAIGSFLGTSHGQGLLQILDGATYNTGEGTNFVHRSGTLEIDDGTFNSRSSIVVEGTMLVKNGVFDLENSSMLIVRNDEAQVTFKIPIFINENKTYILEAGRFTADTISFADAGEFQFTGGSLSVRIYSNDLVNEGGTLAPGGIDAGGDTTIAGDYTQQPNGVLGIDIGGLGMGADYDFINVTGNALIDGELALALLDGFAPSANDTFLVFNAANLTGFFDNAGNGGRLSTTDGGGSFRVNYGFASQFDPDQIVLSDFQPNNADRDNDGDVDGNDFLLIQRTNPSLIPLWETQYDSSSLAAAAFQSVPEPSCLTMVLLVIGHGVMNRSRFAAGGKLRRRITPLSRGGATAR